ncbi:MAG: undecaprenyldiphospho-muramoylpentapeptide beta-N-acetylglucosaminyltransferase [Pseudomonadota bacterium]
MQQQGKLVALAAGGTGGHMFPARALAEELLQRGCRVALVTDKRGGGFGESLPQVETHFISATAILGGGLVHKARGALNLALGYLQARRLLGRLKPSVAVGFGGYASVPTILAASAVGSRVVLHEQNQVVGRANRLLVGRADAIASSFPQLSGLEGRPSDHVVLTGNPVRADIAAIGEQGYRLPREGAPFDLLVTGGSQGARAFNELIPAAVAQLPQALRERLEVVQQVRGDETDGVAAHYKESGVSCTLQSFFQDMPERLAAAHLVVCRAGASTVTELAAAGRPAIYVPYPFAADDHQTGNAKAMAEAGGGWLMPQRDLTAESLAEKLKSLLEDPGLLEEAALRARESAVTGAAARLADLVCEQHHDEKRGEAA